MSSFRMRVTPQHAPDVSRLIELSGTHTLVDLHSAIQHAFELDDDHQYAFFMNGKAWDPSSALWSSPDPGQRGTADAEVDAFELRKNKRFLYLFDFGDELGFDVRVEEADKQEAGPREPRVVESIGEAPPQYEGWEVDYDAEDDEYADSEEREPDPALADLVERLRPHLAAKEKQRRAMLESAYALAVELLDRTGSDAHRIHIDLERPLEADLFDWLAMVPDELAEVGRFDGAADLAERLLELEELGFLRASLPNWLARAGRREEAVAMIEQNLELDPDDPTVLFGSALAWGVLGDPVREEQCLRNALRFASSVVHLRTPIVDRLLASLSERGRRAEAESIRRAEANRREA